MTAIVPRDESPYEEAKRPQLRFSSRRGWLNDPNGLVYFDGEYHLFYQHDPYAWSGGTVKYWGHAVSTDLVHWEELPIALAPDEWGAMYSGSAVIDWDDTAGLRSGPDPAMIALYTAAGASYAQHLAFSHDRGRTMQKLGDPILSAVTLRDRDPKVFWHAPGNKWVMVLYLDRFESKNHPDLVPGEFTLEAFELYLKDNTYGLFSSPDLRNWTKMSEIALPDSECPDLFELPVVGSPGETRWIFFGARGHYLIGRFDGDRFTAESGPHHLHEGNCFYAAQTFSDIPPADGRRILIPWGISPEWSAPKWDGEKSAFAGMPFNQSMGLPVELTLRMTSDGPRVFVNPVEELTALRRATTVVVARSLAPGDDPLTHVRGDLWEIEADVAVGDAKLLIFDVRGVAVIYDAGSGELSCLDKSAAVGLVEGRLRIRMFVDRTAIDIFAGDGRLFMPMGVDLSSNPVSLSLRAEGGTAAIRSLRVHELTSIWRKG